MYQIGQFQRNQMDSYSVKITSWEQDLLINQEAIVNFYDPCMFLGVNNMVNANYSYYLKFEVTQKVDLPQNFIIKLKNSTALINNTQEIRRFNVKKGTDKTVFEIIFSPNAGYDQIIFELERIADDYNITNDDGKKGRIMEVNILSFERIINIVSDYLVNHYPGLVSIKKLGIQGPPGLMFVLDGEEIKIGRSGIYELYHESINITYIGFIVKTSEFTQEGKDYFIMDFKY